MSTPKPPKGPSKPFLGDEDLGSELDAWEGIFDALHEEVSEVVATEDAPLEWPEPPTEAAGQQHASDDDLGERTDLVQIAPEVRSRIDDAFTLEEPLPDLEDPMTLDQPMETAPLPMPDRGPSRFVVAPDPVDVDPMETDFSDIGAEEPPAALGRMLGGTAPPPLPPPDEIGMEDIDGPSVGATRAIPQNMLDEALATSGESTGDLDLDGPGVGATRAIPQNMLEEALSGEHSAPRRASHPRLTPAPVHEDARARSKAVTAPLPASQTFPIVDDTGLTRAIGPGKLAEALGGDDDVYTSASRPLRSTLQPYGGDEEAPPAGARRTPAILRRPTLQPIEAQRGPTPPHGTDVSDFAVPTKVAEEPYSRRSEKATAPPPMSFGLPDDEDDYELEIEAGTGATSSAPVEAPQPAVRRTAHVLRRTEQPTRPPPVAPRQPLRDSDPVIEMNIDESAERERVEPSHAAEDDFSDVAAAVGAADELPPPARAQTPAFEIDLDDSSEDNDEEVGDGAIESSQAVEDEPAALPAESSPGFNRTLLGPGEARTSPPHRPPALVDLYPRVKTPTSVPPLGRTIVGATPFSTQPTFGAPAVTAQMPAATVRPAEPEARRRLATPLPVETEAADREPDLDLEALGRDWPEQVPPLPTSALDEAFAQALIVYEREVATLDDSAASAALRVEAGRLCERLADGDRARHHYDAALLADPRATGALRGLRRIARATGDLGEVTRHLDTELGIAGALERRPLGHYRVDLLMASGEQDLARVAVGEILDSAPSDVRGLLAHLELAFVDGRADEFGAALEQLAHAVSDAELRAAVQSARAVLAAHHNDTTAAATWFRAAAESDPGSLAARLGAIRHAVAQNDGDAAGKALFDLARRVEANDTATAAAAALRAAHWTADPMIAMQHARYASSIAPADTLVARLAAEHAANSGDPVAAGIAFSSWARSNGSAAERAYAAARAAELDPGHGTELWSSVLAIDPGDDYAAAQLRTSYVAAEQLQASIDVDLAVATDAERDRARLRAAYGLIAQGQLDAAIEVLERGRMQRPGSLALSEALGEALAAAGKWLERAKLFAELAADPGEQLDRDVACLRSAIAWEEAVGSIGAQLDATPPEEQEAIRDVLATSTRAALDAWGHVLEHSPQAPTAHAAALLLASRLGDDDALLDVLERAQLAERSPWAAASLALRRARLLSRRDPTAGEPILRDLQPAEDPRRTLGLVVMAMRSKDLADAAIALEDRATLLDRAGGTSEVAMLRLRAAQLALDAGDAARATRLLQQVEQALPNLGIIADLLTAARRRAGERPGATVDRAKGDVGGTSAADAFARIVRDGDLAAQQNDGTTALELYQRALELRPGDPLAVVPLVRVATQLRDPAPITKLALAQLRTAEDAGDGPAKAIAYELLAHIDAELRSDSGSAQIALESASQADPSRIDLMHRLERHYSVGDQLTELLRLRQAEAATIPPEHAKDRAAMQLDVAGLATRDHRPEIELAEIYRSVLAANPACRLALLHLESSVRVAGFSDELAALEDSIATYFEGDPRSQAAFWTRAGETLAEIGKIDDAIQRFGRADAALPGHTPALEGWRNAALKGQLWVDVAEAATRQAANTADAQLRASLHHFAGVALMDKALVGEQAMAAFKRALEAAPDHRDAFLRLRILLEEDANHDDLATLLSNRLTVEPDPDAKLELHRAVAELHRNFLSDRETAKLHYRAILEQDPNDLRAHAAIADIAWEQGNWQEAADALMARARLERQPEVLKTLCFRLGLIYADRLVDIPMALKAFQRALTFGPDDENTLVRLADLATGAGEWKLALGACERLVKNEVDPEKRAAHLHRVAKIFKQGFGDKKRAERALNLALDGAPTNDESLQQLVQFYKDERDFTSVRVHLNRVAGAMRAKASKDPREGVYYRVISRAMSHRHAAGVPGSLPIARAAAELTDLLGAAGEPEQRLLAEPLRPDASLLVKPEADEVLFPRSVQVELRQLFHLLGDRIAKHVGVDLRPYGATRGDRLRGREHPVASVAQSVASSLGFTNELDVYVSARQPYAMVAEPTSPISLVIGVSIANAGGDAIRFAAGSALKLAQSSLAIPARLPVDELGVLVISLLRLFQPEFPAMAVDGDAVATQTQKLRRLIPTSLHTELRPFALAIDPKHFNHREVARDLRIAGLRAGLVTSGSLLAGLRILAGQAALDSGGDPEGAPPELTSFLADPIAQGLITFALSEDLAAVAR